MSEMTKRERVRAAIAGEPVDRVPASLWGHDFLREWNNDDLVAAAGEQYEAYGWDFIKLNPRWTMFPEAWGAVYEPPLEQANPTLVSAALGDASELGGVRAVHAERGLFGEHLEAVRMLIDRTEGEVDVVQTVFSPMSVLGLMTGRPPLLKAWAAEDPAAVHGAIGRITETIAGYALATLEVGAAGIFYAPLQWASRDISTVEFYREFGRPYDLQVLDAVRHAEFNILHVCHTHNMLDELIDYPVAAINWDDRGRGNAGLAEVRERTSTAVMGGVGRQDLAELGADAISAQAAEAAALGTRVLVTAGCSIPPQTPPENRAAVAAAVRGN